MACYSKTIFTNKESVVKLEEKPNYRIFDGFNIEDLRNHVNEVWQKLLTTLRLVMPFFTKRWLC
jgi:hypothetical protein